MWNLWYRCRSRITTDRFPKQALNLLGGSGGMLHQQIFWILTPSSPLSWVSESFRWDIGQFHSPRMKHLSNPFSRFQPGKFLLKIYLLWKIWPISVKRWKPVWIRACYRQHNSPEIFQSYFYETIEKLASSGKHIVIMGIFKKTLKKCL